MAVRRQIKPGNNIVNGNIANGKDARRRENGDARIDVKGKNRSYGVRMHTGSARSGSRIC